jgi:hypothetical protein
VHFEDSPALAALASRLPTIAPEQVLPLEQGSDPHERRASIMANIERWLAQNRIDVSVFEVVKPVSEGRRRASNDGQSLLAAVLARLDESDRRRVQLPLDIVAKLLDS